MFDYKEVGYIYKNVKGEYLVRVINRGYFDKTHYALHFVKDIQSAMLFESKINFQSSEIEYRNLFSEELLNSCEVVKVERHVQYLKPHEFKVLEE